MFGGMESKQGLLLIDDCITGTIKLFLSDHKDPLNIGSSEQVSINQMISIIEDISNYNIEKNFQLDKPLGVRGRSSDNTKIKEVLSWEPEVSLKDGLTKTYNWIYNQLQSGNNSNKFTKF